MSHDTVQRMLRQQPFLPLLVRMSSGASYEVRHPELALLTKTNLYISEPDSDRVTIRALLHIANIEFIETSGTVPSR